MTAPLVQLRPAHTRYRGSVIASPRKAIPSTGLFVLKRSDNNAKLGNGSYRITKGVFRGMALYMLTLEERATCPDTCQNWNRCFGDNMPFAKRHRVTTSLLPAITQDVRTLARKHPEGFVVRLHILGDFPSVEYVRHWRGLLVKHPELRIFGYTHWPHGSAIGNAVRRLVMEFSPRVSILRSDGEAGDPLPLAITVDRDQPAAADTILCPEQTGRTASCLTCGLCMNGRTSVSFIDHSRKSTPTKQLAVL